VAAATIALIAGADAGAALRLAAGILGLQFAIGCANDLADAEDDRAGKPRKPIPAGLVSRRAALAVCVTGAGLGLLAAATVGAGAVILGVVGLGDGLLYDLQLKRTPLAWTAFAAGVGLVPLYAWSGAGGSVPPALLGVVGLAVVAGAALAVANAYADLESDRRSGIPSIATVIGARATLLVDGSLLALVQVVAIATTLTTRAASPALLLEALGCGLAWMGFAFAYVHDGRLRHLFWEFQALGIFVLGAAWLSVLNSAGIISR
jgi:4-hydroxybenzoate polyprenyltransferase